MKMTPALELHGLRASPLGALWTRLQSAWGSIRVQRRARRLRMTESLSLGEKRLLAVVEFEGQRFLVAATPERITLLQTLGVPSGAPPAERA